MTARTSRPLVIFGTALLAAWIGRAGATARADMIAAEPKAEPAAAAPEVDPDGALLGEFVGPVDLGRSRYQPVGLQVRPMGNGLFEAVQYRGGLPGQGARREPPIELLGKRSKDFLVLSGGPWLMFVEPDACVVMDREGRKVGRLERVCRQSPTLGALPPKDAIVLFDGKNTQELLNARVTEDGLLTEGFDVRPMFQDFNLHVEFMVPYLPAARDQGRGNSGVYVQSRYEVQILDSFAAVPVFNGGASLYRQRTPDLNMCFPPLCWQTYDIAFTAARWSSDGTKRKNARITVWHNGVKVHNAVEIVDKTGAGQKEEPTLLPIRFQNHNNPVRFRNLWIVDRGEMPAGRFPVHPAKAEEKQDQQEEPGKQEAAKTQ